MRAQALSLLQDEAELNEIVQLVGVDGLSAEDRLKLEVCKMIREDYLHQNSFHEIDTYTSTNKQFKMLKTILYFYEEGLAALAQDADFNKISGLAVRESIGRFKYVTEDRVNEEFEKIITAIEDSIHALIGKEA